MANITIEQFNEMRKEQDDQNVAQPWRDLEEGKVHILVDFRKVQTKNGEGLILILEDEREFWSCSSLKKFLESDSNTHLPKYLVSLGMIESKKNTGRSYFGFETANFDFEDEDDVSVNSMMYT
jgi:hypothetical protein